MISLALHLQYSVSQLLQFLVLASDDFLLLIDL
jgi:hypothetical protein